MADANIPEALMLVIVTPEREVANEAVSEIQLPGLAGYLGILPGHTPLLTELGIGVLSYKKGGQISFVAISGGFAEVLPGRVTVLAEAAERPADIDVARVQAALAEAEKKLANSASDPGMDSEAVLKSIATARVRLEVATHASGVPAHQASH